MKYGDIRDKLLDRLTAGQAHKPWWEVNQWDNGAIGVGHPTAPQAPKTTDPALLDALKQMQHVMAQQAIRQPIVTKAPLETYPDHELIMEMIARGFAVAKMPAEDLSENLAK